ncbi:MAG: FadR family transcriptional regulator [Alphaproteobacteria bacterium]|nr:FadR family transcriptional regulator [Alphaproteobacteria bacterium]
MHELGRRIVGGEIPIGASLPIEPELCRQHRVSRTTLREAIKKLHGKGLLSLAPKRGTRVRPESAWSQLDGDVMAWRLARGVDRDMVRQLYEIRAAFEPEACRLAALNGTEADHAEIDARFADLAANHLDSSAVVDADVAFHMAVIAATRNVFFLGLGGAIRTTLGTSFELGVPTKPFPSSELRRHRLIKDAILARRGDLAAEHMRALLRNSETTLAAALALPVRLAGRPRPRGRA